jgi:hypothetical protein
VDALELVNILVPEHARISCDDDCINNGFYSNDHFTRCARCILLDIINKGSLPKSHTANIGFIIDDKLADKEDERW